MGQFEWCVMPFGLKGAPGTFQAIMNDMFFDLLGRGVLVYMDDMLVHTNTFERHMELLEIVFQRLLQHKMYPKFSKCKFVVQSIEYLGFRVGADGIHPRPDKVSAITAWPTVLTNDTQVRQFLGTVNYCRNFMGPEFAVMARPLLHLVKHGVAFEWTDEHTAAIKALKERLINYTRLSLPDLSKPFVLRTDASGYAIGAVLEQDGNPIGFLSKRMSETEMRYSTYDQELLAIIRALERWKHLLLLAETKVYTDHRALRYLNDLQSEKPMRARVARWLDFLALFQRLTIEYQPGATNVVADALSRCPAFEPGPTTPSTQASETKATLGSVGPNTQSEPSPTPSSLEGLVTFFSTAFGSARSPNGAVQPPHGPPSGGRGGGTGGCNSSPNCGGSPRGARNRGFGNAWSGR